MDQLTRKTLDAILPLMSLCLKTEQDSLNAFYQEIKHGDGTHQEWLAQKIEEFFKVKIERR